MFYTAYYPCKEGIGWPGYMIPVYDVKRDSHGYPQFLIFWKNQWRYVSAKHFKPMPAPPTGVRQAQEKG